MGSSRRAVLADGRDWLLARIAEAGPDAEGDHRRTGCLECAVSYDAVWHFYRRVGLTFNRSLQPPGRIGQTWRVSGSAGAAIQHRLDRPEPMADPGAASGWWPGSTWPPAHAAYVEKALVPALTPGDIVVLDNPGSNKANAARKASATLQPLSPSYRPTAPT